MPPVQVRVTGVTLCCGPIDGDVLSDELLREWAWTRKQLELQSLMQQVMPLCGLTPDWWPNSCNLNYYENQQQSLGWHADDEKVLGPEPAIASCSFGETRDFCLRLRC